jgi:hypothetical protein
MRHCLFMLLLIGALAPGLGCGKGEEDKLTEKTPEWLDGDDTPPTRRRSRRSDDELDSATANDSKRAKTGKLELHLNEGDRFPITKTIDVELAQSSLSGQPEISRRQLELTLLIEVGEKRGDRTRLRVNYDRVKYSRDVAGEKIEYDSRTPPEPVPFAVRMYHDMVKDGFSFWINAENKIVEADDFRAFLNRCLRNIPEDKRNQVMLEAEGSSGENGISDFVDNSIGLLPFGYHKAGDQWDRQRTVSRPVPMQIRNTYKLEELTDDTALITITGTVGASTTLADNTPSSELRVTITGGHTDGECTVFRDSGLPRSSRMTTLVDMLVQASGVEFRQQQKTVTTIESYPIVGGSSPAVIGAAYEEPAAEEASPRRSNSRRSSIFDRTGADEGLEEAPKRTSSRRSSTYDRSPMEEEATDELPRPRRRVQ